MALVVSVTQDTLDYHRWLQIAIPYIESHLRALGIGIEPGSLNRYCLIRFGGRGSYLSTRFIKIDNQIFFPAESFFEARRQLRHIGATADGYQAIDFALRHIPFRNESSVTKMVIFVGNSERTPLSTHSHITMDTIESLLRNSSVLFNAILRADMSVLTTVVVAGATSTLTNRVLGLASHERGFLVGGNYSYSAITGKSVVTSNKRNLVRDFANLTLASGGLLWSLNMLLRENVTIIESFVGAMLSEQDLHAIQEKEVCERCWCKEGEGQQGCEEGEMECEVPTDQSLCSCLVARSPSEVSVDQ